MSGLPPESRHSPTRLRRPKSAHNGLMHRSKQHRHLITSSTMERSDGGTVRPSDLAVLRLMASSNLVGCSIGRSAGLAPFKILSTNQAARRFALRNLRPPASAPTSSPLANSSSVAGSGTAAAPEPRITEPLMVASAQLVDPAVLLQPSTSETNP